MRTPLPLSPVGLITTSYSARQPLRTASHICSKHKCTCQEYGFFWTVTVWQTLPRPVCRGIRSPLGLLGANQHRCFHSAARGRLSKGPFCGPVFISGTVLRSKLRHFRRKFTSEERLLRSSHISMFIFLFSVCLFFLVNPPSDHPVQSEIGKSFTEHQSLCLNWDLTVSPHIV